jgi:hypothetical protein
MTMIIQEPLPLTWHISIIIVNYGLGLKLESTSSNEWHISHIILLFMD